MNTQIDWQALASKLDLFTANGERSGDEAAQRALELIIGEDALRQSVDYYIAGGRGSMLARSVLWQLRPWSAMSYCYEIFNSQQELDIRRSAVELLRVVADRRAVPWITEFLNDSDAEIQSWGIGVLDQLLFSKLVESEEVEDLISTAEGHASQAVRECAERIRLYLRD